MFPSPSAVDRPASGGPTMAAAGAASGDNAPAPATASSAHRRCQEEADTSYARALLGTDLQPDLATASKASRLAGRASGHGDQDKVQRRQALGGVRRPQGTGQLQDHFCPWLLLLQTRRAQRLPGASARTGHLPVVLRPAGVLRERRAPGQDGEEHRRRHREARRQPAAGAEVPPHGLLHGRRDHVELPQLHPAQRKLSGVAILAPVGNYWWPGLPPEVYQEAWYVQFPQERAAVWVAHHLPWLTNWWNTQRLFPSSSVKARNPAIYSTEDKPLAPKLVEVLLICMLGIV